MIAGPFRYWNTFHNRRFCSTPRLVIMPFSYEGLILRIIYGTIILIPHNYKVRANNCSTLSSRAKWLASFTVTVTVWKTVPLCFRLTTQNRTIETEKQFMETVTFKMWYIRAFEFVFGNLPRVIFGIHEFRRGYLNHRVPESTATTATSIEKRGWANEIFRISLAHPCSFAHPSKIHSYLSRDYFLVLASSNKFQRGNNGHVGIIWKSTSGFNLEPINLIGTSLPFNLLIQPMPCKWAKRKQLAEISEKFYNVQSSQGGRMDLMSSIILYTDWHESITLESASAN